MSSGAVSELTFSASRKMFQYLDVHPETLIWCIQLPRSATGTSFLPMPISLVSASSIWPAVGWPLIGPSDRLLHPYPLAEHLVS
jgi:hypothetical protein